MIRAVFAYLLAFCLSASSLSLAYARGVSPDIGEGIETVICTGAAMVTMVIGQDGEPVESVEICPDGARLFAANFVLPIVAQPERPLLLLLAFSFVPVQAAQSELMPSARGPPVTL